MQIAASRTALLALLAAGLAALAGLAPAASAAAGTTAAAMPANLRVLVSEMAGLQLSSERVVFTDRDEIYPRFRGRRAASRELERAEVEVVAAPLAFAGVVNFPGWFSLRLREAAGREYLYEHEIAARDGGRPWIALGAGRLGKEFTPVPSASEAQFAALAALIEGAGDFQELGPGTVDGQAVTTFAMVISGGDAYEAGEIVARASAVKPLAGPAEQPGRDTLEISFRADGVPVRVHLRMPLEAQAETFDLEVPAVNVPFTIEPPPASRTITEAALARLTRAERRRRHKSK